MKKDSQKDIINGLIATLENLIEQLEAVECQCCESEERFRLVADFASDWEYWHETDGRFVYTSPSCQSITGYMPEEFAENPDLLRSIVHPEDLEIWQAHSHARRGDGDVEPIEFRIKTKSGKTRWMHHVCRTVYDKSGKNRGVRGSNRDITQQKQMQEEIQILRGFLPICASCKNIRDDKGFWSKIESYISARADVEFSHGICPDCFKKKHPEIDFDDTELYSDL